MNVVSPRVSKTPPLDSGTPTTMSTATSDPIEPLSLASPSAGSSVRMEVVCEDWNEDFVFDTKEGDGDEQSDPFDGADLSGRFSAVVVPQAIKERQANVHGDLGQMKDFASLVDDLKRLRTVALARGLVDGPHTELWAEAEDIIDLATSNHDTPPYPTPSLPSSPGLGPDGFDDDSGVAAARRRRKSVLALDDEFFAGPSSPGPRENAAEGEVVKVPSTTRPASKSIRHDAPSVARTVIETMHQRRTGGNLPVEPALTTPRASPRKMPFDSTTLRELVSHVRALYRKLADLVRSTETPMTSRSLSPRLSPAPSFGQVLAGSVASSPSFAPTRPSKRSKSTSDVLTPMAGKENDVAGHLLMAVI
ncbi:MAG: hypothetical protein M1826_005459 [Phylliscum demangeonii]|nr:MAG: hypothetical protein M1826_005459 [Phylliscum demangeonii]